MREGGSPSDGLTQALQAKCMPEHLQSQMLSDDGGDDLEREEEGEDRSQSCCDPDLAHRFELLLGPRRGSGTSRWGLWVVIRRRCWTWLLSV